MVDYCAMDAFETNISKMRADIEKARADGHAAVDRQYRDAIAKLEELEIVLQSPAKSSRPAAMHSPKAPGAWPGLRAAIRKYIANEDGEFTIFNVVEDLNGYKAKPEIEQAAVSVELWWMCKEKEIELIHKGRPNVYRRAIQKK